MDPVSIVGVVGSILGISDIIARSLRGLVGLQSAYKAANLLIAIIIGHLTTVKAALHEIGKWATKESDNLSREQLVSDVQRAVSSCEIIVLALDERINSLTKDASANLGAKARMKFALEEQSIKEFSDHLGNQVQALSLLMSAANSQTNEDRSEVLNAAETRQVIRQVEDDSSSYMQGDEGSSILTRRSRMTTNTEFLDREFDFDDQVLNSNVYRQALRSILQNSKPGAGGPLVQQDTIAEEPSDAASVNSEKTILAPTNHRPSSNPLVNRNRRENVFNQLQNKLRGPQTAPLRKTESPDTHNDTLSPTKKRRSFQIPFILRQSKEDAENAARNALIEEQLRKERLAMQLELKMLILGIGESGKSTLLKDIKLELEGSYTYDERKNFKEIIFSNLNQSMWCVLEAMESLEIPLEDVKNEYHKQTIYLQPQQIEGETLPMEVGLAIIALRSDSGVQDAIRRSREYRLQDPAKYWFENAERIMDRSYVPTAKDILTSRVKTTGITETTFSVQERTLRVFDCGGMRSERKKWIHCFEDVSIVTFTVDIGSWDQMLFEDETVNRMQESFTLFDSLVNSRWFVKTGFIILFTKVEKLRAKLDANPGSMSEYLTDFPKEGTFEEAMAYIENRFISLCKDPSKIIKVAYCSIFEEHGQSYASAALSHIKTYRKDTGWGAPPLPPLSLSPVIV